MRVLALNCGSSSVKSALIDTVLGRRLQEMHVENVGSDHARLHAGDSVRELPSVDLPAAVDELLAAYGQLGSLPKPSFTASYTAASSFVTRLAWMIRCWMKSSSSIISPLFTTHRPSRQFVASLLLSARYSSLRRLRYCVSLDPAGPRA